MGRVIHGRPGRAPDGPFGVIVVGGGAYGAFTALEAARRGLDPLLLERADFGGETSRNSLRIVHGGLRYLQSLDLRRFRRSVRERRWMLRTFPSLVRPLRCVMPLDGRGPRRRSVLRAALAVNDLLSWDRNRGVRPDRRIPPGAILDPPEVERAVPEAGRRAERGGAAWHDAEMIDAARLLVEALRRATARGAVCLNYTEAEELLVEGGRVRGIRARDRLADRRVDYRSDAVVNCAGPWAGDVAGRLDRRVDGLFRPSLAFNVLLRTPLRGDATVAATPPGPDARTYFVRPWKGFTLAGTYHAPRPADTSTAEVAPAELEAFLDDLRAALPGFDPAPGDVRDVLAGLLPVTEAGTVDLATSPRIHDHGASGGAAGLVSVRGVKYTTARRVGEEALRAAASSAGFALPSADAGSDGPSGARSVPTADGLRELAREAPGEARALVSSIVREEAVTRTDDLMHRRTEWALTADDSEELSALVAPWVAASSP